MSTLLICHGRGPASTIQLTATALNANGEPLSGAGQATFSATDSSVTVSPSGLVTAHFVTQSGGTKVVATMQQNNVTLTDTAFIRVTETAPAAIATFSIQPAPGDSAIGPVGTNYFPTVTAKDVDDNAVAFSTPEAIKIIIG